jgi:fatty-acyl-CoA synthase
VTTLRETFSGLAEVDSPGLLTASGSWSWREYVEQAELRARAIAGMLDPARPPHVGVLLDNTAEMAFQLAAAGIGGHVVVGLNTTRRGTGMASDITRSDCQFVVTDAAHRPLLEATDVPILDETQVWQTPNTAGPPRTVGPATLFMLIFTSGTSGEPKAVRMTHEKVTFPGIMLADRFQLTAEDVCYVSMPLFHSNAIMAGWSVAIAAGAAIALGERFSASGFIEDARRYGATYANYVGKPLAHILATPPKPDDDDNPLRVVFGNEAGERDITEFGRRFGCLVWDGFGSTENAVIVTRTPDTPTGSIGQPLDGVAVLDPETSRECPRAVVDEHGNVSNLDDAVGELVNTLGAGQFAGYYNDEAATSARMRDGMYWSGDLAWRDQAGYVYFAGRTSDWLRVDGENLAAAPIERILLRHPLVSEAAVYAVPDPSSGDQLVAALVLREDVTLSPAEFESFLAGQEDLGTKAWPRHVLLAVSLPRTATNKVLKRALQQQGLDQMTWIREERGRAYSAR